MVNWPRLAKTISVWVVILLILGLFAKSLERKNRLVTQGRSNVAAWNATDFGAALEQFNEQFEQQWQSITLEWAPDADILTVARRLSLALRGTVPSLEELRALEQQPPSEQLDWWLDHLLSDVRSADYLAERFARAWVGTDNGPFLVFRRRRFVLWLSEQFQKNRPYDEIVRELLTAEGLWTSRPAVNFVTASVQDGQPDPVRLAGRTARSLLAVRLDCLQCHDDHLGNIRLGDPPQLRSGTQRDFHQLAAFFGGLRLSGLGLHDRVRPYHFQFSGKEGEEIVPPRPPFRSDCLPNKGKLRERLAGWVTSRENPQFARATVNRVWALLFGKPLIEPIDDIPLAGPYPVGLEYLAEDFSKHGYDLHRLIRLIAHSVPFHRSSRAEFPITAEHERHWAVFPLTRLRPEQIAGAILQACSLTTLDSNAHVLTRLAYYGQTATFVRRFGDRGEDEFTDQGGTIPQRLLLMNGQLVKEHTQPHPWVNAASQIALLADDERRAVETAYLAVLSRRPTPAELEHFRQTLAGKGRARRLTALEDLYWVLLNSTEFSWNH